MATTKSQSLPETCRALVCLEKGHVEVQSVPTPNAVPGSVVVRIISAVVEPVAKSIFSEGLPGLWFPTPYIPGTRAIGRVAAIGSDTTSLKLDQFVILDPHIRGRDDSNVQLLWGAGVFGGNPAANALMEGSWRNGMYAEYARAPLENCYALNESILMGSPSSGGLGYSAAVLASVMRYAVAYGGLRSIDLKAGETIIIAPATGIYTGAAVEIASAMGARVIAASRNIEALNKLAALVPRVQVLQLKGKVEEDLAGLKNFGVIDAYLDMSPFAANESTHVRSCMMAVRQYGRVSLMGVSMKDIPIPYVVAVMNNLTIRGQYMYEREDVFSLIKLVEAGVLKLGNSVGHEVVAEFGLEDYEKAFDVAEQHTEAGKMVLLDL
ncbi:GroES-like protein [Mollisia scopiformis]|uniref:GroES-like protein n=1 Tax=Mollisia scopiformis TaxID=149040 RepID=A0A194X0U1_MOLSC|nr:GroES-like protein [Mollisia scopiformis]KUJ13584.1 GroES-like protein [Mollisia scopiformis]